MWKMLQRSQLGRAAICVVAILVAECRTANALTVPSNRHSQCCQQTHFGIRHRLPSLILLAKERSEDSTTNSDKVLLPSSDTTPLPQPEEASTTETENDVSQPSNNNTTQNIVKDAIPTTTVATVPTMISIENKRILIEELGYKRRDVDQLKFEMAPVLVEQRIPCPTTGLPASWCRSQEEFIMEQENKQARLMEKLEQESKYPFKVPLLGASLILFGKGFSDALITIIKVNMNFPGSSLVDEFLGVPVLLIDALCVAAGASLGWWTWNNMK